MSSPAVNKWPSCPPAPTPTAFSSPCGIGKLIQLLGAEQCTCSVKSGYFWILLPPRPTQAIQISVERCFPRNTTQHRVGLQYVINTEQGKCAAGTAFQGALWDLSGKGNYPPYLIAKKIQRKGCEQDKAHYWSNTCFCL